MDTQSYVNTQKWLRKPKALPLIDLEPLYKQEVDAKAELSTVWLNVEDIPQPAYRITGKDR